MTPRSRSDVYFAAAKLISERGLAHGAGWRATGQYCIRGAVVQVSECHGSNIRSHDMAHDLGFESPGEMFAWNDRATKVTAVRRLLRAAVKTMG